MYYWTTESKLVTKHINNYTDSIHVNITNLDNVFKPTKLNRPFRGGFIGEKFAI